MSRDESSMNSGMRSLRCVSCPATSSSIASAQPSTQLRVSYQVCGSPKSQLLQQSDPRIARRDWSSIKEEAVLPQTFPTPDERGYTTLLPADFLLLPLLINLPRLLREVFPTHHPSCLPGCVFLPSLTHSRYRNFRGESVLVTRKGWGSSVSSKHKGQHIGMPDRSGD